MAVIAGFAKFDPPRGNMPADAHRLSDEVFPENLKRRIAGKCGGDLLPRHPEQPLGGGVRLQKIARVGRDQNALFAVAEEYFILRQIRPRGKGHPMPTFAFAPDSRVQNLRHLEKSPPDPSRAILANAGTEMTAIVLFCSISRSERRPSPAAIRMSLYGNASAGSTTRQRVNLI